MKKKTYLAKIQVKRKGLTGADVYRIMQNGKRAHTLKGIGWAPLDISCFPADPEYRDFKIKSFLVRKKEIKETENFYLEVV